ncbi:MAG: hypothetical protein JWP97_2859 [Labilithrix sp.]|nr:hypothetical protein [Labilithrix sp.]
MMGFDAFSPFTAWNKGLEMVTKMQADSVARASSFFAEIQKLESKTAERGATAIDEMSVLGKETLAYSVQLAAEMRKMQIEAVKQATAAFAPKA